jgi:hypothetical protein
MLPLPAGTAAGKSPIGGGGGRPESRETPPSIISEPNAPITADFRVAYSSRRRAGELLGEEAAERDPSRSTCGYPSPSRRRFIVLAIP